jgi:hypothetical protein
VSKARGDRYIIERDERDVGGKLIRIAEFDDWTAAKAAWESTNPDASPNMMFWLCRLNEGIDDPAHCFVIESKEKE